ncbi:MAG: hypothetical protein R3B35_01330 [Gemmatimonadales bacterium]
MPQSRTCPRPLLLALLLAACGGEPADGSAQVPAAPPQPGTSVAAGTLRACDLLTLEGATRVMGTDTERPADDTEQASCTYSRPGVAMMTLQIWGAEDYDRATIMQPHVAQAIGERGRSHVAENGATSVQFVQGTHSITMSVTPFGRGPTNFLGPMVTLAREIATRIPAP